MPPIRCTKLERILPREAIPSHYSPLREVSPRDLAWETHGQGNSVMAVVIIPPLPPNVTNSRASNNKPRRWKSLLTHQWWFTALYSQHLLTSQNFEFLICILLAPHMQQIRCTSVFYKGRISRHSFLIP